MRGLRVDPKRLAGLSEAERSAVLDELRLVEGAFKENPLLGYWPHEKQVLFHQAPFPDVRAFFGGNRSGKTTAAIVDTIVQSVDGDVLPEHLRAYKRWPAPFRCRVMTPDFGESQEAVLEKIREWCPRGQLKGGGFDRAYDKVKRILLFKNGSRWQFNSNVQERDQLGGTDLHRVVYDEEPREDLRGESAMRLADHDGEEIFAMTPFSGMSWLYDEIYEPWERGVLDPAETRVVVVDIDENPHMSPSGKRKALAKYSGAELEARKTGRFVSFSGLIYPAFSTQTHVIPSTPVPDGVEVFAGIDPGIRHMCAVVYAYLDQEDRMVVFDEVAAEGQTIREVCKEIQKRNLKWGVVPRWFVIDPSSRNKNHQTGRSDQQEFSDHGVPTIPGQNSVSAGINRVKERLELGEDRSARLLVMAHCTEIRNEFKRYRWAKPNRTENESREQPVKKDDHLLDALRYICMQRPLVPEHMRDGPSITMKQRLLRHHLKQLDRVGVVSHPSGPGIFAG